MAGSESTGRPASISKRELGILALAEILLRVGAPASLSAKLLSLRRWEDPSTAWAVAIAKDSPARFALAEACRPSLESLFESGFFDAHPDIPDMGQAAWKDSWPAVATQCLNFLIASKSPSEIIRFANRLVDSGADPADPGVLKAVFGLGKTDWLLFLCRHGVRVSLSDPSLIDSFSAAAHSYELCQALPFFQDLGTFDMEAARSLLFLATTRDDPERIPFLLNAFPGIDEPWLAAAPPAVVDGMGPARDFYEAALLAQNLRAIHLLIVGSPARLNDRSSTGRTLVEFCLETEAPIGLEWLVGRGAEFPEGAREQILSFPKGGPWQGLRHWIELDRNTTAT